MAEIKILVVDDDEDIAINVHDILIEFGYQSDTAFNGLSAIELVEKGSYDIALLDFKMPDMDGATLFHRLKKIQPRIVAIMVTAYAGSDGVTLAKAAGVKQVMQKPVDIFELLHRITKAVA